MDAREQDAVEVKQRFHAARRFLFQEFPLRLGEAEIMMAVEFGDAAPGDLLKFRMVRSSVDDERRIKLFEDVAVLLQKQREEFLEIVGNDVEFQAVRIPGRVVGNLDGFVGRVQSQNPLHGKNVSTAE